MTKESVLLFIVLPSQLVQFIFKDLPVLCLQNCRGIRKSNMLLNLSISISGGQGLLGEPTVLVKLCAWSSKCFCKALRSITSIYFFLFHHQSSFSVCPPSLSAPSQYTLLTFYPSYALSCPLVPWTQPYWHQGPVSWQTIFPWTRDGEEDGFRMIQAHYIYYELHFYYFYTSPT